MKSVCSLEKLQEAAAQAERVTGRNTTLPILSYVKISANKNTLTLTATNLEIGVHTTLNAKNQKEGEIVVPAQILNQFLSSIKNEQNVSLEVASNTLTITTAEHNTTIKGGEGKNFPIIPQKTTTEDLLLNTQQLFHIIQKTAFATTTNETRPELTGVFVALDDTGLRAAATDSFRLAESTAKFSGQPPEHFAVFQQHTPTFIVPKNTCQELLHLLPKTNTVSLAIEKNQLFITTDHTTIMSRIIEGSYPDYQQIIPKKHTTKITVEKEALLGAVRVAAVFAKNQSPEIVLSVRDGVLTIRAESHDTGSATTDIAGAVEGDDIDVVLNAQYVSEGVTLLDTEKVSIGLTTGAAPVVFTPLPGDGTDLLGETLYIVMPIKNTTPQ